YTGDYSSLTLSVSGDVDPVSVNPKTVSNCYTTPNYVVDVYCGETNGEYVVTISDNGVTPLPGTTVEYEIITTSGGVPLTPYTAPVNEIVTGQSEVTVNVYVNGELVASDTASCYVAPR